MDALDCGRPYEDEDDWPGDEVTDEVWHAARAMRRARARAEAAAAERASRDWGPCGVLLRNPGDPRWWRVGALRLQP